MERATNPAGCRAFARDRDEPDNVISPWLPTGLADGLASVRYAVIRPRFAPGPPWFPRSTGWSPRGLGERQSTTVSCGCNQGARASLRVRVSRIICSSRRSGVCHHLYLQMPRPTSFGKDTGLQIRMTVTLFLLGLVYVVFIAVLLGVGVNGGAVAIIAGGLALLNLFASDKLALAAMGARVVTPEEAPQLHAMIDRLCVQADLPKPRVAVANTRMPNAFALGRSPKSATVCATTGIMEMLSPAELEGVMAHELTHVANR